MPHGLGILHRDIKPGNLMVDDRGHIWVTDFGLARLEEVGDRPGGGGLTESGDLPGTLRYMSPEQAAGGRVLDPRTDVYSLGATLYELLAGRPAFGGTDRAGVAPPDRPRRAGPAATARPGHPARPGDDRRQGDGQGARASIRHGPRAGRRPRPLPRRPADPGAAAGPRRAAGALVPAAWEGDGGGRDAAGAGGPGLGLRHGTALGRAAAGALRVPDGGGGPAA